MNVNSESTCERKLIPNLRLRPTSSARVAIRPRGVWGIMPHSIMDHAFRSVLAATVQGTPARKFSGFHPVHICGVIVRADVGIVDRIVGGEGACVPAERAVAALRRYSISRSNPNTMPSGLRSESRYARNAARTFGGWPRARRRASANGEAIPWSIVHGPTHGTTDCPASGQARAIPPASEVLGPGSGHF